MKLWKTQELIAPHILHSEGTFRTDTSCVTTRPKKDNSRSVGHSNLHLQKIGMVVVEKHWEWHEVQLWENTINRDI